MIKKIILFTVTIVLFTNCFSDKKSAIGTNFNDTSFVNKKFTNKVNFSKIEDVCSYISAEHLAKLYNVNEADITIIKGNSANKRCSFYVKLSDQKFDHITGSIGVYEEKDKLEDGSTWVESWQIRKNVSKSAEWIPNLGQAAYYRGSKRELFVKFKDYTMSITAPGSTFNKIEKEKNRDYKKIALALANKTPILK